MSHQQFHEEVQQWEEMWERDAAVTAAVLRESAPFDPASEIEERDFVDELGEKFPILKAWPGRKTK